MTASPSCTPDLESIAAYLDGTLPDAERSALEKHLAVCDVCSELLAETHQLINDETLASKFDEQLPVPTERRSSQLPQWSRWLIAAGLVLAAGASVWVIRSASQPTFTTAALLQELPTAGNLRSKLDDGWIDGRWSVMRGSATMVAPPEAAFRLGARAVDLAAAIRAGDLVVARTVTHRIDAVIESIEGAEFLMLSNFQLQQLLQTTEPDIEQAGVLLKAMEDAVNQVQPAVYVQAGQWAAAANLATMAGAEGFFKSKQWQAGVDLLAGSDQETQLREISERLGSAPGLDLASIRKEIGTVFAILGDGKESL